MEDIVHEIPVLVVGGGPVGLLTAWQLARSNVRCMLAERNTSITRWPKMDVTNCRSMELLKSLGLADLLREQGKILKPYGRLVSSGRLANMENTIEKACVKIFPLT